MPIRTGLVPLAWDSEFLEFPVARLLATGLSPAAVANVVTEAQQAGIRLIYVLTSPTDAGMAAVVRRVGAQLVDRKVTFAMSLGASDKALQVPSNIGVATVYTPQLESLAWQSGEFSRFRLDPRFAPHVFQALYTRWLLNSLAGTIARQVLVWRASDGTAQGLLTLGDKDGRADIGLLAVDVAARGQRVGQHLVAAAKQQAREWGYQEMQVVTQRDNESACRFYAKCGFGLAQEEHIYHLWLD